MRGNLPYHLIIMLILGLSVCGCHGSGAPDGYRHPAEVCHEAEVLLGEQRVSEAMIAADEALTAPGADDVVKGRSCLILSLCHTMAGNSASALTFAEMALAHTPEDEDTQTVYADALIDARRYSECVAYIDSVPDAGKALRRRRIPALIGLGRWQRVVDLTDSIDIYRLNDTELVQRAYALASLGRLSSADLELGLLELDEDSPEYSREELRLLAEIYTTIGDRGRAAEMEHRLISMQDSLISSLSESKIYEDIYNIEHSRRREEEDKVHRSEMRLLFTIVASVLLASLLVMVMLVMRLRVSRHRAETDRQLLMMRDELRHRHEESHVQETSLARMSARVDRLFRDHYEAIEMAANLLLDASLSKNSGKKIADSLAEIVDRCREPKFLRSLEQTVNDYRDNVIGRLRSQIPGLSDSDMAIVLYSAAGLTPRVMCLLTGLSASALYNRKYRLKKRIAASGAADTDEFIGLLEQ